MSVWHRLQSVNWEWDGEGETKIIGHISFDIFHLVN